MEELADWGRRALDALRAGSAWERYDFDLERGTPIIPVVRAFEDVTQSLGLDSDDACALLYVPLPEDETTFPALSDLDPWRDILVPQLYLLTPSTMAAWMRRTETWTVPLDDPTLSEGITVRGLTVSDQPPADTDVYRSLVLRREADGPVVFDTLD